MTDYSLSPHLRYHPAAQKTRALFHSPDNPVGPLSLYRLRLAHPDTELEVLLFQALDVVLWVSGQRLARLRLQGTKDDAYGLLALGDGCLCTLDLHSKQPATLAFEIHGQRGLLHYDDTVQSGIWLQPAAEPARNLVTWPEQCRPRPEEAATSPAQADVETVWQAALASLADGEVWHAPEMTT